MRTHGSDSVGVPLEMSIAQQQPPGSTRDVAVDRAVSPRPRSSRGKRFGERMYDLWERLEIRAFSLCVRRQLGACGRKVVIEPPFKFKNLQLVSFEDHVTIKHYGWISAIDDGDDRYWPKILIQAHSSIGMGVTISAVRRIVLGKNVLLARNVYISDHGHAFEDVETPIMYQGVGGVGEVHIGDHTWIGQNACIMPGVRIGKHCVIGANSVVTKDLPDYSVAVGTPARIIKQYNAATRTWERVARKSSGAE